MGFFTENLSIILLTVFGIGLIVLEMFLPGIGLPGISGGLMLMAVIILVWNAYGAVWGSVACIAALCLIAAAILISLKSAEKGKLSRSRLFLKELKKDDTPAPEDLSRLAGLTGVAQTPLRPSGIIQLEDGQRRSVVTQGEYVDAGKTVRVIHVNGSRIVVKTV